MTTPTFGIKVHKSRAKWMCKLGAKRRKQAPAKAQNTMKLLNLFGRIQCGLANDGVSWLSSLTKQTQDWSLLRSRKMSQRRGRLKIGSWPDRRRCSALRDTKSNNTSRRNSRQSEPRRAQLA